MRNLLLHSFRMNIAIFSNTLIYRLRSIPLVKHIIPSTLYGNEGISAFITIIMTLIKAVNALLAKVIYILSIMLCLYYIFPENLNNGFLTTMVLLSFFGAFSNNKALVATKEKYYAVVLMRIDANQYAKMDFIKQMVIDYLTFTVTLLLTGIIMQFNLLVCLIIPIYIIACKTIVTAIIARLYGHPLFTLIENNYFGLTVILIALAVTGAALYFQVYIPVYAFIIVTIVFTLYALYSFKIFMQTKCFKAIYKKRITLNTVIFDMNASVSATTKKSLSKKITYDESFHSKKSGYEYFNEIFTKRHKKILTISAYRFAGIYLAIILLILLIMLLFPQMKSGVNEMLMNRIPYFLFVMYFTNRGAPITQAMFVNCDFSMLHYRFYRRPEVILGLFKQRLKTVISVNLIPSLVIAIGLCVMLYASGGTNNPLYYLLLFICINAMSAFFSVHYLVLYYVLQPYNINMQAKGGLYTIISSLTYFVCYALMQVEIATFPFTIAVIIFSIVYILISLAIAYKQAYRTFKIKN